MSFAVVGCRYYQDYEYFRKTLDKYKIEKIVSGGASGADSLAERYAKEKKIPIIVFPAEWEKYGKKAGPLRNTKIVETCEQLIAFPSKKSRGTWDSVNKAKMKGKNVFVYCV